MSQRWTWGCPVRFGDYTFHGTKRDRINLRMRAMCNHQPPWTMQGPHDWRDTLWWYRYLLIRRIHAALGLGVE